MPPLTSLYPNRSRQNLNYKIWARTQTRCPVSPASSAQLPSWEVERQRVTMSSLVLLAALGPLSLAFQSPHNPLAHRAAPLMSSAAAAVEDGDKSLFQPAGEQVVDSVSSFFLLRSSDAHPPIYQLGTQSTHLIRPNIFSILTARQPPLTFVVACCSSSCLRTG